MFENPASNSPHLRKSSSKSVFIDPGKSQFPYPIACS